MIVTTHFKQTPACKRPASIRLLRAIMVVALGGGILVTMPGCVFWRLNQFRQQLGQFPEYFLVEEGEAATLITAQQPVLRPDDLGWLTGLAADPRVGPVGETIEAYHYIKQYLDADQNEAGAYDLLFELRYNADDRLEGIGVEAPFASLLTMDNFNEVFQPMKHSTDERRQQTTGWSWDDHRVTIPDRTDIKHFFGIPYTVENESDTVAYTYVYLLDEAAPQWNPTPGDVHLRFVFSPEDERVIFTEAYKGRIFLRVDLRPERNQVAIKRLRR